ncbi:MAG: hypothetical protein BWY76_01562 [bacterium ADurb.Bin429]|nr:MAG: hypothetical protein BWY76_01562 [bacterium ADurb.Bin429]
MRIALLCCLSLLLASITKSAETLPEPQFIGPTNRFMEDATRYMADPPADKALVPQVKVTRQSYRDFITDASQYGPVAIKDGPDRGVYGVRHAFPALVHYDATADKVLGEGIKKTLRYAEKAVRAWVAKNGEKGHEYYMFEPTLLCMYRAVFMRHNNWSAEDEAWFKVYFLWLNRTVHVWGGVEDYWRGPMHRATGEGIMKLLAATMYPDAPEAAEWKRYGEIQWNDWWAFRDNPINDINYYHGQIFPMALGAHLLKRPEVFTDPGMRKFWDRLIDMTTPDGAVVPFGPSWGWNSHAGERLMALEIAAAYTRDGRYRFVAHRIFNQLLYQADTLKGNHMLDHFSQLGVAVAYFIADDTIVPVTPSPGSALLTHKETLRVKGKAGGAKYLPNLDPDPLKANIDCALLCTQTELPFKLCLRSGWNPGDMYMLVDLFPRHEPMNVTGILGFTRYNAPFTCSVNSKGLTDWLNMLKVEDLSGTASVITNPNPDTVDAYYMDVTVPAFADLKAATYAAVDVRDYNGFPMTLRREFFFIKNRFVVVRDTATFREAFLARLGPTWATQNVGMQVGPHWANTYLSAQVSFNQKMKQPPMDLLVYHAPKSDRRLQILDETADVRRLDMPLSLRYVWQGVVQPGQPYAFTHLMMPDIPRRKSFFNTMPGGVSLQEVAGQYIAAGVTALLDTPERSVWRVRSAGNREEWVVLNATGAAVDTDSLRTDARQAYVDTVNGKVTRVVALGASYLTLTGLDIVRQAERGDIER